MSKYVKHDSDYKRMDSVQKVDFDVVLTNYDVDANVETSKGRDVIQHMWDIVQGKKGSMKIKIEGPNDIYVLIYTVFIALDFVLLCIIVLFFLYYFLFSILLQDPIKKIYSTILFKTLLFVVGITILTILFSRLRDNVQTNIEKIVYKL